MLTVLADGGRPKINELMTPSALNVFFAPNTT